MVEFCFKTLFFLPSPGKWKQHRCSSPGTGKHFIQVSVASAMPLVVKAISVPSYAMWFPTTVTVSIMLLFPDTWHQGPLTNFSSALLPSCSLQSHSLQRAPSHTTWLLTPVPWALGTETPLWRTSPHRPQRSLSGSCVLPSIPEAVEQGLRLIPRFCSEGECALKRLLFSRALQKSTRPVAFLRAGGIKEISVPPSHFCCKPKTALKFLI